MSEPTPPPVDEAPAPEPVEEIETSARIGSTERGLAANNTLRALSRAARSFLLYDPSNAAIRVFLDEMKTEFENFGRAHGSLPLAIRPFELLVDGEVVYLERDRERSLAFKLFRDGVRFLIIEPDVEWAELLRLLEILSIRYTGIRQNEDDIVTLLWKANFQHIEVEAVEGFVPEDEELPDTLPVYGGGSAGQGGGKGPVITKGMQEAEIPRDFDLPGPVLGERVVPRFHEIPEEARAELLREDGSHTLPGDCLTVVRELAAFSLDPTDPLELTDTVVLVREIRDFLLSDGQLGNLVDMLEIVRDAAGAAGESSDDSLVKQMLDGLANPVSLSRLVRSIPIAQDTLPDEVAELFDQLPGDRLEVLVDLLEVERAPHTRSMLRQLIRRYAGARFPYIKQRIDGAAGTVAADLLRAAFHADEKEGRKLVLELSHSSDTDVQLACVALVAELDYTDHARGLLFQMLHAKDEAARVRAIEVIATQHDRRDFPQLRRHAREQSAAALSRREAEAIGMALASLDAGHAMESFREWARPKGFFQRFRAAPLALQWSAAAGLGELDDEEADELLRKLADKSENEDLRRACMNARMKRQRRITSEAG